MNLSLALLVLVPALLLAHDEESHESHSDGEMDVNEDTLTDKDHDDNIEKRYSNDMLSRLSSLLSEPNDMLVSPEDMLSSPGDMPSSPEELMAGYYGGMLSAPDDMLSQPNAMPEVTADNVWKLNAGSFDLNQDGMIDQSEAERLFERRTASKVLTHADGDGDSSVSVDEFGSLLQMLSDKGLADKKPSV